MSDAARRAILAALPAAPAGPWPPTSLPLAPTVASVDPATLLANFTAAATAAGAVVTCEMGIGAARLALLSFLRTAEARQVLVWPQGDLPIPGLLDALQMLGIETLTPDATIAGQRAALRQEKPVWLGLISGLAGLADQGSIIVRYPDPAHMLAAVWPQTQIILLPVTCLAPSFAGWLVAARQQGDWAARLHNDMTIIAGPSLSMDIEQTPVRGAAGPAQLHIFLIGEDRIL